jgi:hypothetical protein
MNIRFNYLHRDAANNQKQGFVIFSNPDNLNIEVVDLHFRESLLDGEFFDPTDCDVPRLTIENSPVPDHAWNEYSYVELTEEHVTDTRSIVEFLSAALAIRQ